MKLKTFQSLWGFEPSEWPTLFPKLVKQGFSGVEASLSGIFLPLEIIDSSDIGFPNSPFFRLIQEHQLEWICGIYTGWDDYIPGQWQQQDVVFHIQQFKDQLAVIESLPILPIHINSHTGSDDMDEQIAILLFGELLKIQSRFPIKISHETHRGRVLNTPWAALRLLQSFPQMRFTLDISHWNVVCERLVPIEILEPILKRVDHVHARIGTHQSPQVSDPHHSRYSEFTEYHHKVWNRVWEFQQKSGRSFSTITPEYGPSSDFYMPVKYMDKNAVAPVTDLQDLIHRQSLSLVDLFQELKA